MIHTVYDVVVIGGGASGMMAALVAAKSGAKVVLIEKNKTLGAKLLITGGGRCNITNAEFDIRILLKNYSAAEKYLYSAFTKFGVQETINFFEDLKLPIKVEAKNRAFPASNKASDVVMVLADELNRLGVDVILSSPVTKIAHSSSTIYSISCGNKVYKANKYILATGGVSRPETGSTGDGFAWLKQLGHSVKSPTPSITPLATKGAQTALAMGTAAKNIQISFYSNGKKAFRLDGDILFTHFGISGPLILNNAYRVAALLEQGSVSATIDFLPSIDHKTLDTNIINVLNLNGSKQAKNTIAFIPPDGLGALLKYYIGNRINLDKKTSELSQGDRKVIVEALKNFTLEIDKLMGADKAVVADGGVSLKEVDTRTFKSTKINNLYITGDLLDINRPSGGYSLQLCWTSGYIAGLSASRQTNINIHFICRGNVLRSLIAETYLRSLEIPDIDVSSSGTNVDLDSPLEREYFANTLGILKRHSINNFVKTTSHQLTQKRADNKDFTICMNKRVAIEAAAIIKLPSNAQIWDVIDIGEGHRTDTGNRITYEEEIFAEIKNQVDQLVKTTIKI